MNLPVNTLSRGERAHLAAGTMTDEQVEVLFTAVERNHRAKVRAYRRAAILVAAISVLLWGATAALAGLTPAVLFAGAAVAMLDAVALVCTWHLGIGIFRRQFNAALLEGHPAFASRHQL